MPESKRELGAQKETGILRPEKRSFLDLLKGDEDKEAFMSFMKESEVQKIFDVKNLEPYIYYSKATLQPQKIDVNTYLDLGWDKIDEGKPLEAVEFFQKALVLNPNDAVAYLGWGVALGNLGRYEEAIEKYQKAVEINPKLAEAYYNLACAYSRLNQKGEAIKNLKKAIEFEAKWKEEAKTDKDFDNLRQDPEFKKLIGE